MESFKQRMDRAGTTKEGPTSGNCATRSKTMREFISTEWYQPCFNTRAVEQCHPTLYYNRRGHLVSRRALASIGFWSCGMSTCTEV